MSTQPTERWIPRDTLAVRVLLVRTALGLSQREAAARSGLTFGSWQSMEDGRSPRDLPAKVARISVAFGVDRDWLMWGGPLARPSGDDGGASPEVPVAATAGSRGASSVTREYPPGPGPADLDAAA